MMLLLYILIGAGLGAFLAFAFDMKTEPPVAIGIAILGGLVGGLVFQILIPFWSAFFGILGAIIGAVGLIAAVSATAR